MVFDKEAPDCDGRVEEAWTRVGTRSPVDREAAGELQTGGGRGARDRRRAQEGGEGGKGDIRLTHARHLAPKGAAPKSVCV